MNSGVGFIFADMQPIIAAFQASNKAKRDAKKQR